MTTLYRTALALLAVSLSMHTALGNPILKKGEPGFIYTADPSAEVFNGKVYVYCSRDVEGATGFSTMQDYSVLESSDLKTWINHGVVLRPRTDPGFDYATGQMNAPDAAYKDGWYYYYFPYDKTHVGVAKSRTPVGPWETAVSDKIASIFDPTVFVDDDGQAYIYGNDHKIDIGDKGWHVMGAKLKDNMVELDGPWHRLSKEQVAEAVTIFKRNGVYYFMARMGAKTGYFMADNPLPYPGNPDNPANPKFNSAEGYASYKGTLADSAPDAPNHTSAIEFKGKWWFFYHRGDVNEGAFHRRSACVDEMHFNEDGTIRKIVYTLDEGQIDAPEAGVAGGRGTRCEAEDFSAQSGVKVEPSKDVGGGRQIGYVNNGDWVAFKGIDFGGDPTDSFTFRARASSKNGGGTIELRLGSQTGKVVGVIDFKKTGGWQKYETFSTPVSGLYGTQDLYLTFSGGEGNLLNLNWFEWEPVH